MSILRSTVSLALTLNFFTQHVYAQDPITTSIYPSSTNTPSYPNCPEPAWSCGSFGVDFHNGGNYFQDIDSDDDFTFATQFDECQPDFAYNLLVGPNGQEYLCSNTTLTPDNVTMTSTCPISKSNLTSGDYSVIMLSNNGQCAPFAHQRNFVLTVDVQQTTTVTPLVIFTSTSTPIKTATTTSRQTVEFYLPTGTVTSHKSIKSPTRTVTPRTTSTITTTLATKTLTRYDLQVVNSVKTINAKCSSSPSQTTADPTVTYTFTPTGSAIPTAYVNNATEPGSSFNANFVQQRVQQLHPAGKMQKRAPDTPTITIIQTNPSSFITQTSTITAATVTTTSTCIITSSTTSTPIPITLYLNPITTIVLPTTIITQTRTIKLVTTWLTATKFATAKITITSTNSKAAAQCTAGGGFMA